MSAGLIKECQTIRGYLTGSNNNIVIVREVEELSCRHERGDCIWVVVLGGLECSLQVGPWPGYRSRCFDDAGWIVTRFSLALIFCSLKGVF